ncbi:MAG: tRNA (adenosine(37)-N6)-threonylcarbamoyltransferase complex transferase subunit TsaD [Candidatus Peribacteraceae bacterium]|nr:tRNA (adenosine(37)-N6)-threonylcarbamoyltransferase complex transferase subunit TsaD [Candidatus Peribacteraceae bacterium]
MIILGIETSCDETAVGIVQNGTNVLANAISSSKNTFSEIGGVIPEKAARAQVECMLPMLHLALKQANISKDEIDAIAVTKGSGLLGSLLVGVMSARTLAMLWRKPLIGIPHTLGHLSSVWLDKAENPTFPAFTLSVSGGHTELWIRKSHSNGELLGQTRDDAAGEAFDKGAAMLGLPYPGGPSISKEAECGDEFYVKFPLPLKGENGYDWSFSGLKTSLKYVLRDKDNKLNSDEKRNISASYEYALCNHLCDRVKKASKNYPEIQELHLVGGVSANNRLRSMLKKRLPSLNILFPEEISYCTDNGAMIAAAGYFLSKEKNDDAFKEFRHVG